VFLKAYSYHVGFEVLTAVSTKMAVFWTRQTVDTQLSFSAAFTAIVIL
jgi:hypothetical protein